MDASEHQNDKPVPRMDWQQVVLNGGPPCFALFNGPRSGSYCGRAQRWAGHDSDHKFVSLVDLLATVRAEERKAAFRQATEIVKTQPSTIGDWMTQADVAANLRRKIVWALERALTEKQGKGEG